VLNYDDPAFGEPGDDRGRLLVKLLTRNIYGEHRVAMVLEKAGLNPGVYDLSTAQYTWAAAVPDAARDGKLSALVRVVSEDKPAFGKQLAEQMGALLHQAGRGWYRHDDPFAYSFVGVRNARAVIDRIGLRSGLRQLAEAEYLVLVVHGPPRSGKSHTWLLVDHLRAAGRLVGVNRFTRVTTHGWSGEVTGEAIAQSLAAKLGVSINLAPSGELDDARIRKFLDRLVGVYPQDDGVTRWIILDGLDRPGVLESARDLARGLIQLVEDAELPQTRLIVTGLDPLGLHAGYAVRTEEIPAIDRTVLRAFLSDVATHLGRTTTEDELEEGVAEILGPGPETRDLGEVETAVVRLVTTRWVQGNGQDA
jgi:hypothetical protein